MRPLHYLATLVVLVGLAGCGDGIKRVPVQGKLTAKGTPIKGAVVQFVPLGEIPGEGGVGQSDDNGNFSLKGLKGVTGVAPGEYKVRISRFVKADGSSLPYGATEADNPDARQVIPAPYSGPDSPLTRKVPESGGTVDVDLPVAISDLK
jgi:hypothetical protein